MSERITVEVESVAHGGDGIARVNGKVTFVHGAIPGDRVEARVISRGKRFDRAAAERVVDASADRVEPPCPHFGPCGGCTWQMASHQAQARWKEQVVEGQLRHLGRMDADVRPTLTPSGPYGYRNRMDLRVAEGRPALLEARSDRPVPLDVCLLPVPVLAEAIPRMRGLEGLERITLRAGVNTGEAMALVDGTLPAGTEGWGIPVTDDPGASISEVVSGHRFRITGRAFFQVNTAGAETLARLAAEAAAVGPDDRVVDLYAGGGLFAVTLGETAGRVVAVESDPVAVGDLAANTRGDVQVVEADVAEALHRLQPPVDVVVVDPPRAGLGPEVVDGIARLGASTVVSVSCDVATFARDARALADAGYSLEWVQPVDLFPQSPHIETVARFTR